MESNLSEGILSTAMALSGTLNGGISWGRGSRRAFKGNVGQAEATKKRNRRNNRLARKNRRLNIRKGNIHGKQ